MYHYKDYSRDVFNHLFSFIILQNSSNTLKMLLAGVLIQLYNVMYRRHSVKGHNEYYLRSNFNESSDHFGIQNSYKENAQT